MQKISTIRTSGNTIVEGDKLTIGLDLGDRFSSYCVLDEGGKILLEQKLPTTPEAIERTLWKDAAESHSDGDGNAFSLGEPTADGAGA